MFNGDTSNRIAFVVVEEPGGEDVMELLASSTLNAGAVFRFPSLGAAVAATGNLVALRRVTLAGIMTLRTSIAAIAINQDSNVAIGAKIWGRKPTVTLTSPANAVETVNADRVI